MDIKENEQSDFEELTNALLATDVYLLSGNVDMGVAHDLVDLCLETERSEKCILILTTYGGDAHAAFKIARTLRHFYGHYKVYIFGPCKSAGTLVVLGAD